MQVVGRERWELTCPVPLWSRAPSPAMRLALSLPVLLVALWMVCEGRAPAQADLEPDQADLEPDGVTDVIRRWWKKVGKRLGKEIVKYIIDDINKKNRASATRKMPSKPTGKPQHKNT
ncbi:apolipoprotein C-I-like isoform X1 [Equus przewalskii]|uniref:Apolipoprotein C-I-like isoform X1 n=1 Tax=Equus przewalskii TaxID=9798 RepID=A0ABM4QHU4_EQUPR|nr:apolipoprotein C-I-like isoform X2 [Equus caballus]